MAEIEFTSRYYLCMSRVKPETHFYTQLYMFPLKRSTNNKPSLFINVHFDLEQENVHNRHQKPPFNFKSVIIKSLAEWILDLTPSSAAVRGWFGLYYIGTCTTCRYWKTWNRCFVSSEKNDTFRQNYYPKIQLYVLGMIRKIHYMKCKVYVVKL